MKSSRQALHPNALHGLFSPEKRPEAKLNFIDFKGLLVVYFILVNRG